MLSCQLKIFIRVTEERTSCMRLLPGHIMLIVSLWSKENLQVLLARNSLGKCRVYGLLVYW
eukprot:c42530_g1_i1 orf=107-289(+)